MKKFLLILFFTHSIQVFAKPLHCVVTFIEGDRYQDFIAEKQSVSSGEFTQYALVNKMGVSFYANESKMAEVLNLLIIENQKTHLGTSPVLNKKGQRACLTIDLGLNSEGLTKKVSISCEAL